ncbi:MAG TPA: DUF6263 family protein [Bacteroidales bacterium]|nr:DUF6263 family protein [Bacteroidales bacterium]
MKKLSFSVISIFLCLAMSAQTSVNLKLNPEKNKVYRFQSQSEQTTSQTVNGMDQTTSTDSRTYLSIKMIDASQGLFIAEARFDSILTKSNSMGQVVQINSNLEGNMASKDMSDVMSCVMHRICKNPLYVKLEPTGKVTDIVNLAMLKDLVLKDTGLITGMMAPAIKMQAVNSVGRDQLISMIQGFTYFLPAADVKPGEKWTTTDPLNAGGMSLVVNSDYILQTVSDNTAAIVGESSIKAAENAKPMEYSGAKISYESIMGLSKSSIIVDTATGFVKENKSKMTMTGNLGVAVQGMNMEIPMKVDSETTVAAIL